MKAKIQNGLFGCNMSWNTIICQHHSMVELIFVRIYALYLEIQMNLVQKIYQNKFKKHSRILKILLLSVHQKQQNQHGLIKKSRHLYLLVKQTVYFHLSLKATHQKNSFHQHFHPYPKKKSDWVATLIKMAEMQLLLK